MVNAIEKRMEVLFTSYKDTFKRNSGSKEAIDEDVVTPCNDGNDFLTGFLTEEGSGSSGSESELKRYLNE